MHLNGQDDNKLQYKLKMKGKMITALQFEVNGIIVVSCG